MSTPITQLADALQALKHLQDSGRTAIKSADLSRSHRERLLKQGFIVEVIKGWYIASHPEAGDGDSGHWYASYWGFCADYLNARFGTQWCLSPEHSISLHNENWAVPQQIMVRSPKGNNKPTTLRLNTSVFDLRLNIPAPLDIEVKAGIRIMSIPAALIACSAAQYRSDPDEMRSVIASLNDTSEILRKLLEGGHSTVAGRIVGALRNIGRQRSADTIAQTMQTAGYTVIEVDPFESPAPIVFGARDTSPHVNRIRLMWENFRQPVIDNFPTAAGLSKNIKAYLGDVDNVYVSDAYHSLSIEGYRVSEALIENVRAGTWNPDNVQQDRDHLNALAARGYWQSFQRVKKSIASVLKGDNAGTIARDDLSAWYSELFGASVSAGIINPSDLAGYRNMPVYIKGSMHTPPRFEAISDLMAAFFDLLENETNPAVRVVLGHFVFVYIHPYVDGNGRIGRFLMNTMLASGGYPWIVIPVEQRSDYMAALEAASVEHNIVPFTRFVASHLD